MNIRASGKFLIAAGIICFAAAFVLLSVFKGEFGKDTAGTLHDTPRMEDTLDVAPQAARTAEREPERLASIAQSQPSAANWIVYVTGAVRNPGVYEIAPSSRVYEALNAAGGFASDADQEAVNLAAKMQDGAHIKFPRKGEAAAPQSAAPAGRSASALPQRERKARAPGKININSAELGELESLTGIGPKIGRAIIDYREANGPFQRLEDLMKVKGVGPKKFDAIKDDITVGG